MSIVKVIIVGVDSLLSKPPEELRNTIAFYVNRGKWQDIGLKETRVVPLLCKTLEHIEHEQVPAKLVKEKRGGQLVDNVVRKKVTELETMRKGQLDMVIQEEMRDLERKVLGLLEEHLICITETGCQQAFWDLISIFKDDTSVTLFVHRLCDKLDDRPCNYLGNSDGPSGLRATPTTAQAFKAVLRGVHPGKSNSKIAIIGTHPDVPREETIHAKNKRFGNIVPQSFKDNMMYCGAGMKNLIFEVNTNNPKESGDIVDRFVKQGVKKSEHVSRVSVWWYILEMILEELTSRLERKVFSKQECESISNKLGFDTCELEEALAFFHKLNIFFYRKDILPDVVFTSSQVPLDKVSELVEKWCYFKAAESNNIQAPRELVHGKWRRFRDEAIISVHHLDEFPLHYEKFFTPEKFMILLQRLKVIAPISESEYFFPSLLNTISDVEVDALLMECREIVAPFVIHFPLGCAPRGVYCHMICYLQLHAGWKILKNSDSHELCISQNKITFAVDGCPVTCIDNFQYFVVCVDEKYIEQDELKDHCQIIKKKVISAVKDALVKTCKEEVHWKHTFLCPCNTVTHLPTESSNSDKLICPESNKGYKLTAKEKIWLEAEVKGKLINFLEDVGW